MLIWKGHRNTTIYNEFTSRICKKHEFRYWNHTLTTSRATRTTRLCGHNLHPLIGLFYVYINADLEITKKTQGFTINSPHWFANIDINHAVTTSTHLSDSFMFTYMPIEKGLNKNTRIYNTFTSLICNKHDFRQWNQTITTSTHLNISKKSMKINNASHQDYALKT